MTNRFAYLLVAFLWVGFVKGQKGVDKIHQLKLEVSSGPDDTVKIDKLLKLAKLTRKTDLVQSIQYATAALALSKKLNKVYYQIYACNGIGDVYWFHSDLNNAYAYYYKALQISDSINDKANLALSLYNLGWISCVQQRNKGDLKYLYRALSLSIKEKETFTQLNILNALGSFYSGEYGDKKKRIDFDSALYYFNTGLDLSRKSKIYGPIGVYNINLGDLFQSNGDYNSSKFYYQLGLEDYKKRNDSINAFFVEFKIAKCDFKLGNVALAKPIVQKVHDNFLRNNFNEMDLEVLETLIEIENQLGQFQDAVFHYKQYVKLKDEVNSKTLTATLGNIENKYSLEKSQARLLQAQQANEIAELKNKRNTYFIVALAVIGLVIIFVAYLLYRQNKLKQITNLKLKEQNKIISDKKHEIEQSIEYAKGIQTTFLPEQSILTKAVASSFVLYLPKDVVSGDFFWFKQNKQVKQFYIACADCTGHGVPGALMSMVGINMLQQICHDNTGHTPSAVLRQLNNAIKDALKQHTETNKQRDGMDLAFVRLDLDTNTLHYAGANRPLYIVRNGEVIEIKPTKYAIGGYTPIDQEYAQHEYSLKQNDLVILSTDGYADQFGGPDGKKMMTKQFKQQLTGITHLKPQEQKEALEAFFLNWKGSKEQVDDVCVIGFTL